MLSEPNSQAGQEVRRLMIDKGWLPEELSAEIFRQCGVQYQTSTRTIYRVLQGMKPSLRTQIAIAHVLGVPPSHLWGSTRNAKAVV